MSKGVEKYCVGSSSRHCICYTCYVPKIQTRNISYIVEPPYFSLNPLVATHTSDGNKRNVADTDIANVNSSQKLSNNRTLPMIILLIDLRIADGFMANIGTMYAHQTPASKVITTEAACSGARVFQTPGYVSQTYRDRTTPQEGNNSIRSPRRN